ncbi:MAG: V-type ATPase subunit [Lachnospiraceae bacterium]|nr:V-type ATPase subunit [Lachnospiraceae bacterium]
MGELLAYSGVTTKLRAIDSRLFTIEEYLELAAAKNVAEGVNIIRQHSGYQMVFSKYEGQELHRGQIENILNHTIGIDFQKIYRFSSVSQRRFLDMYFEKYEISVLKRCLRMIFDHRDASVDLSYFQEFFSQHSKLKPDLLSECKTVEMLLSAAGDTKYADVIRKVQEQNPSATLWDYGMALDYQFFMNFWNQRKKYLKGEALEIITEIYGVKMELLNINWIARCKQYYSMTPAQIYAITLPVGCHLRKRDLKDLIETVSMEDFQKVLAGTYYGRHYPAIIDPDRMETCYPYIRNDIQHKLSRKEPYSVAVIISYIFDKECEIDKLTSILECVRYGIDAQTVLSI